MKLQISTKRIQINKSNTHMVAAIAVAAMVSVFSLVASRALISQSAYQQKVINEKEKAKKQLKENLKSVDSLVAKYEEFDKAPVNVLDGNPDPNATGERDGPNSRLVLDALPSKYDFPALATSLEKILLAGGYKIESIVGSDEELAQAEAQAEVPAPVDMPFSVGAAGTYASSQKLIIDFERSIRPFHISTIKLQGSDAAMTFNVQAKTYYQPEKSLEIRKKVVK